jgi:aryl-alcohol dehydrogenase-like predicted oxidoreductase
VEASLRELGRDYIDLYQVHWRDPATPFEETAAALGELVDEGKIRHVGVSNFDARQIAEFSRARQVEALQPPYHLFRRDVEAETLPYAREQGIAILVYSPLAHGLLTGTMSDQTTFADDDSSLFQGAEFRRSLDKVADLERFAEARTATVSQLAIAWTLANPAVQIAIVGTRSTEHIAEAIGATELELGQADLERVEDIMSGAVPVAGPSPEPV